MISHAFQYIGYHICTTKTKHFPFKPSDSCLSVMKSKNLCSSIFLCKTECILCICVCHRTVMILDMFLCITISLFAQWRWCRSLTSSLLLLLLNCFSRFQLMVTPWTGAYQAPPSMGFSKKEYWSGLPLPSLEPSYSGLKFTIQKCNYFFTKVNTYIIFIHLLEFMKTVTITVFAGYL